jgi:hypothetical protein
MYLWHQLKASLGSRGGSRVQPQYANAKFSPSEPLDVGMTVILSMKDYTFLILFMFASGAVT